MFDWNSIKFGTDIHSTVRMNPTDFGDPLTFSPVPPWVLTLGLKFSLAVTYSNVYSMVWHKIWCIQSWFSDSSCSVSVLSEMNELPLNGLP